MMFLVIGRVVILKINPKENEEKEGPFEVWIVFDLHIY